MQRTTFANVIEQILPVLGACGFGLSVGLSGLRALRRAGVAEIAGEDFNDVGNERAGLLFPDVGQILELDLPRLAAVPAIKLFGLGMGAEACELLPVAQKLDLFGLSVGRHDVGEDLRERLYRTKQYRPLRRLADSHQH